jgi:hypothetical protein
MFAEEVCDAEKRLSEEDEVESSFSFARPAARGEKTFERVITGRARLVLQIHDELSSRLQARREPDISITRR